MQDFIETIRDIVTEHGIKMLTAAAFTFAGLLIGRWRAAQSWKKREFFDRLNVSLNALHGGKLLIRTVLEKTCEEILLNRVAVERLIKMAQQTTRDNPLIPIPREDRWFYLNAVLNELSETFAEGLFKREAGKPHEAIRYLICLTNECDGEVRTRKVRAMVIRKDMLVNLPKDQPALESPNHAIRWKTLQHMQKAYAADSSHFIEAEIVV
ncbi:MAG: hypothetical protein O2856_08615 [Planctomycetota bacterium]|nr:hypothetical protein [Planctomycetota bacterium]